MKFKILAMIEEAAGIRMYEAKREHCLKTIKKKDEKLTTINSVCKSNCLFFITYSVNGYFVGD